MSTLQHALHSLGADALTIVQAEPSLFQQFCESENPLLERAAHNKPDRSINQHLLGILTKAHLELSCGLENQTQTNVALKQIMRDTLGEAHQNKFQDHNLKRFELVCHLWFYLQGCLGMDFSLANDHAEQSAVLIGRLQPTDSQALRTMMMESFYLGLQFRQQNEPSQTLWQKLKMRILGG